MRLRLDEMQCLHGAREEEYYKFPGYVVWLQTWFDFVFRDVWARQCDLLIAGSDPVTWAVVIEAFLKKNEPGTIASASPGVFQGSPLSALRDEDFRVGLKEAGLSISSPDHMEKWFYYIFARAEMLGVRILFISENMRAFPVRRGVMSVIDRNEGKSKLEANGPVALSSPNEEGRSSEFFNDSAQLFIKLENSFRRVFAPILSHIPKGRRYGDVVIASKVLKFSMMDGHFEGAERCHESKIVCFDFSNGRLATISHAVVSWKADVILASQVGRQLKKIGE
jgi:hypothetical protein